MSLARAFTTRRAKQSPPAVNTETSPQRSKTLKSAVGSIRHKISAPVELIHTTNMLTYSATDIYKTDSPLSLSTRSDDSSMSSVHTAASSPPTSPDVSSEQNESPEPNHLSTYFTAPTHPDTPPTKPAAPAIPQRSPSHTKKGTYEALSRQRSVSHLSEQSGRTLSTKPSLSFSRSSSASTHTSANSHGSTPHHSHHTAKVPSASIASQPPQSATPTPPSVQHHKKDYSDSHPFGQELAQVTEIAEEYGIKERLHVIDEEEQELVSRGLFKFSPEEYISEVRGIFATFFVEPRHTAATWI